jgi:HlyD family secretion protein
MSKLSLIPLLLLAVFAAPLRADQGATPSENPVVEGLVKVSEENKLPAKEAGVLVQLSVQEGIAVKAGQVIGKIDDSEPQMQKRAAKSAYAAAHEKWKDDIELRYAGLQADVAKAKVERMQESNRLSQGAVTTVELNEAKLEWDRATLGIEKSGHDRKLAYFDTMTKLAELDAAELAIQRRIVTAPFDGIVEEIKRHQDEWVQPGDMILTLLRMDTMHVEGAVEQDKYDPHQVQGCEVTLEVPMAHGRTAKFRGRIIKVSQINRSDGVFNIRAEVTNQQENGHWLLREGAQGPMTIHLGTGNGTPAISRSR